MLRLTATEDTWNDDRATTTTHGSDPRLGIADSSPACFVIAGGVVHHHPQRPEPT